MDKNKEHFGIKAKKKKNVLVYWCSWNQSEILELKKYFGMSIPH